MAVCSTEVGVKRKTVFLKASLFMLINLEWLLYIFIALLIESSLHINMQTSINLQIIH